MSYITISDLGCPKMCGAHTRETGDGASALICTIDPIFNVKNIAIFNCAGGGAGRHKNLNPTFFCCWLCRFACLNKSAIGEKKVAANRQSATALELLEHTQRLDSGSYPYLFSNIFDDDLLC